MLEKIDCNFIEKNKNLINFYLEENLQNLYPETVELMAKGFLHKIEHTDILNKTSTLFDTILTIFFDGRPVRIISSTLIPT